MLARIEQSLNTIEPALLQVPDKLAAVESDLARLREDVSNIIATIASSTTGLIHVSTSSLVATAVKETLSSIRPLSVDGFKKVRVGGPNDGGYVMLDDFDKISAALSLGIGSDTSWDQDISERGKGIKVLQFDHSIAQPIINRPRIAFFRQKIVPSHSLDMQEISIPRILLEQGLSHNDEIVLKMDIEGDEWDILEQLNEKVLLQFRQIVCEFHSLSKLASDQWRQRASRVFEKLQHTHQVIHVHGNNHSPLCLIGFIPLPDTLEITFVRRADYRFSALQEIFPTNLDAPNNPHIADIFLGTFQFKSQNDELAYRR